MGFLDALFSRNNAKTTDKTRNKSKGSFVKTGIAKPQVRKSSAPGALPLNEMQKAHLVKKGNAFLEEGNTTMAHKIFARLKVYEGLMRVSKAYYQQGRMADAHGAAHEAWAHRDPSQMTISVSGALRMWLHPDEPNPAYAPPSVEDRRAILRTYQKRL